MSLLLQDTLVISPATVQRIDAEIEEIKNNTDVADVIASKAELNAYDTSRLTDNAIIKVLQDESKDDASTYYRYIKSSDTFELIGSVGPYYTKAESNNIEAQIRKDFEDADTTLQNNITAEETRATSVENQLRTDLTAETTRATGKETELNTAITTHTSNTSNPHSVTKAQVGLGNVDNTSDLNKPISTATQTALNTKVDKVTISTTTGTVTLADNTIFNGNELSTLTITNPSSPTVDFSCQVNFTSGATPTTVTASNIVWVGDNVSETVGFVPRANCRYTVMFMYDGSNIRGIVQGVSL